MPGVALSLIGLVPARTGQPRLRSRTERNRYKGCSGGTSRGPSPVAEQTTYRRFGCCTATIRPRRGNSEAPLTALSLDCRSSVSVVLPLLLGATQVSRWRKLALCAKNLARYGLDPTQSPARHEPHAIRWSPLISVVTQKLIAAGLSSATIAVSLTAPIVLRGALRSSAGDTFCVADRGGPRVGSEAA